MERVSFLWVVVLQVCVIVLRDIMESLANTAVKVVGKGPPATNSATARRQPVTTLRLIKYKIIFRSCEMIVTVWLLLHI